MQPMCRPHPLPHSLVAGTIPLLVPSFVDRSVMSLISVIGIVSLFRVVILAS